MPTQTTSPGALAALMETAHDCGYTLTLDSRERGKLSIDLHERDDVETVPVADGNTAWLLDRTIFVHSWSLEDGRQWVHGQYGSGLAIDAFAAAMHEYFTSLAIQAVPA